MAPVTQPAVIPPRPTAVIATVCVTLRAVETRQARTTAAPAAPSQPGEMLTSRAVRRRPLVAPRMLQTMNAGAARTSTTSNALTTIVATTVPASTHCARTASGFSSSLHRRSALKNRMTNVPRSASAGTKPRSETEATQSLLGQGFAVIPSSVNDRSPEGAKRTYSTGQFPGPTPTLAATASQAARERDRTSAAATSAPPSEPTRAPNGLRAVTVHQTSDGSPITAMCATKFRLPNVPPGARLVLKYSLSIPYACAREKTAAQTAAIAAAMRIDR